MKNFNIGDNKSDQITEISESVEVKQQLADRGPSHNASKKYSSQNDQSFGKMTYRIEVSLKTIVMILLVGAGIYLGIRLLVVIAMLFFAFAFASALLPLVRSLQKKGMSKNLSIATVYIIGIILFTSLVLLIVLPLSTQINSLGDVFSGGLDKYLAKIADVFYPLFSGFSKDLSKGEFLIQVEKFFRVDLPAFFNSSNIDFSGAFETVSGVGKVIGYALLSLVISVYIIVDHDNFLDLLILRIIDQEEAKLVRKLIIGIEEKLGKWLMGQVTLSIVIGFLAWLMLTLLRIPYAIPLAVLAGILEVVPGFGPTIASIPSILLAFITHGPTGALFVVIGYVVIQQLENTFIVPRVMGNATGLKRIAIIIGVVVGFTLAGPVGTLLAVPTLVLLQIAYEFYVELQKIRARN